MICTLGVSDRGAKRRATTK